jgi:hypothetical protein
MKELVAYKCTNCGRINHPRHSRCLNCRQREFETVSPVGEAKLLTFTQVCTLPWGIDDRCRTLGIVEFENNVRAMGWLKVEKPKTGMKLKAAWGPVRMIKGREACGLILEPTE